MPEAPNTLFSNLSMIDFLIALKHERVNTEPDKQSQKNQQSKKCDGPPGFKIIFLKIVFHFIYFDQQKYLGKKR